MSRAGYSDDMDDVLAHGRWRAQVLSAIRGKRGQRGTGGCRSAAQAIAQARTL